MYKQKLSRCVNVTKRKYILIINVNKADPSTPYDRDNWQSDSLALSPELFMIRNVNLLRHRPSKRSDAKNYDLLCRHFKNKK